MKAEDLKKTIEGIGEDKKDHVSLLEKLIEKCAMEPDQVKALFENSMPADVEYPELASVEDMTTAEFGELYKKMEEEVKNSPAEFEHHMKITGMSEDELALLFGKLNESVEKYPEIWESKEAAQLLHPKNLGILIDVLKKH